MSVAGARAVVYVAGAVAKPGVYALPTAARAEDALRAAGGPTAAADLVAINLAARVEDGEEIAVPLKGVEAIVTDGRPSQTKRARRHAGKRGHRRNRHRQSDGAAGAAEAPPATDAPVDKRRWRRCRASGYRSHSASSLFVTSTDRSHRRTSCSTSAE
jgi:protein involved in polysaccharide export with SLBB domain